MNQLKIIVEPNQHGQVDPQTVRVIAVDPKRRVEVELQTVTGLRLESVIENGRHRFVAQLVVFDPALDLRVPVEQIDVIGDKGVTEAVSHLQNDLRAVSGDVERLSRELAATTENSKKAVADLLVKIEEQAAYIEKLEAEKLVVAETVEKPKTSKK